jgi:hypothetical protein
MAWNSRTPTSGGVPPPGVLSAFADEFTAMILEIGEELPALHA